MATSKSKVVASKEELRRFMKETKAKLSSKKIDHPLAKYNKLGQLVCVLCKSLVKSDALWISHVHSKLHTDNFSQVTSQYDKVQTGPKRKGDRFNPDIIPKKILKSSGATTSGISNDFSEKPKHCSQKVSNERSLGIGQNKISQIPESSSEDSEDETMDQNQLESSTDAVPVQKDVLPADFFDQSPINTKNEKAKKAEPEKTMAEALPEGFFDDPVKDAKVRNVEYKDKMEEEWELFKKAMKEEAHVSEAIMEEEEEQANVERNIDEIDDQIYRWSEINDLQNKKEEIMKKSSHKTDEDSDSNEELDEMEFEDFMNWRSKKSWT